MENMQNPKTGLFVEQTHHFMHTTAHCTAALELLDVKPLYKFKDLEKYKTDDGFNDLHALFGTVCALAELQNVLYDEVNTTKPLRLVLDRRPFI